MGLSVIKFLILIFKLLQSICRNYQANDKMIWLPFYPYSPFTALGKTSLKCYMKWQDLLKTFRGILTLQSTRFSDWPVMAQKFSTKFRGAENTRRTFSSAPDTNWNLLIIAKHLRSYPCIWGLAISCQVTWVPKKIKKKMITRFKNWILFNKPSIKHKMIHYATEMWPWGRFIHVVVFNSSILFLTE